MQEMMWTIYYNLNEILTLLNADTKCSHNTLLINKVFIHREMRIRATHFVRLQENVLALHKKCIQFKQWHDYLFKVITFNLKRKNKYINSSMFHDKPLTYISDHFLTILKAGSNPMRSAQTTYKLKYDLAHKNALWDYLTFACIEFSSPASCGLDCVCIPFSAGDLDELIGFYKKGACACTEFPVCYPGVLGGAMSHYWECPSPLALQIEWSQSS